MTQLSFKGIHFCNIKGRGVHAYMHVKVAMEEERKRQRQQDKRGEGLA